MQTCVLKRFPGCVSTSGIRLAEEHEAPRLMHNLSTACRTRGGTGKSGLLSSGSRYLCYLATFVTVGDLSGLGSERQDF